MTLEQANRSKDINFQYALTQHLKWKEYWRCDPKLLIVNSFINTLSLTPQGDGLVVAGNGFLTLWHRDSNMNQHSYSLHLFYGQEINPNMYAQSIEKIEVG